MKRREFQRCAGEDLSNQGVWLLHHGIRNILRCDEALVVSEIARYVMLQHPAIGAGSALMERKRNSWLPSFAALLGCAVRFLEVRDGTTGGDVVFVARLNNERRALEIFPQLLPELRWSEITLRRRPTLSGLKALVRTARPVKILRIARLLHRRYEFFRVLRAVELIGYYAAYLGILRSNKARVALMSSHSIPHGIAFNLAVRRCGLPVALITHGMPVRPVARLAYELAVVHCDAARQTYVDEGCRMDRVLVHGRLESYASMPDSLPERLVVGIFLCKDVNEDTLRALVSGLFIHQRIASVLIRPHPKNLWLGLDKWIDSLRNSQPIVQSKGGPVSKDLEHSDVVLAGNSSVLVDAVTAGRPAACVSQLDYAADDMHEFVRRELIFPWAWKSGEMGSVGFDPEAMLTFYRRPGWLETLRRFANIEEEAVAVNAQAASIMRVLAMDKGGRPVS